MKRLTQYLKCVHRPEAGTMVRRWLREVTPADMRTSYEYLLVEAQGLGSRLWLLDMRRRNNEDPETAQWRMDAYMPQLAGLLGASFLAYLLSPTHLVRVDDHAVNIKHVAPLQRSVHVALFLEEGAANEWLVQQAGKEEGVNKLNTPRVRVACPATSAAQRFPLPATAVLAALPAVNCRGGGRRRPRRGRTARRCGVRSRSGAYRRR